MFFCFGFFACSFSNSNNEEEKVSEIKDEYKIAVAIKGDYLGSEYKGNFVWGGAMNLAWTELSENIVKEKIKLKTDDDLVLSMLKQFNNPVFTKKDLDDKSYYIKSGYGQKTVDLINKESKEKFPDKSFKDLDLKLSSTDIISYAYFLKKVEYLTQFEKGDMKFEDKNVESFYAKNDKQRENVKIHKYENENKFIISLQLKDDEDQLYLVKGYDLDNPKVVVDEINKNSSFGSMNEDDTFRMPNLHLDYYRVYKEFIGKYLLNKNFDDYFIAQMFENIKFDMDNKGARVENEAVIMIAKSVAMPSKIEPKYLILDEDFWVVMKRADSDVPYFLLGVDNVSLMDEA